MANETTTGDEKFDQAILRDRALTLAQIAKRVSANDDMEMKLRLFQKESPNGQPVQ